MYRRLLALPVCAAVIVTFAAAATRQQPMPNQARAAIDTTLLKSYRWRSIGPDRGGRSIAASGVRGRPKEAYFGATGGGLWKTMDGGETWAPVTDGQIRSASVGAVAVSDSNPDVVYIGMGETCIRGNIMPGDGVYKSSDGGKTWVHVGLAAAENIAKIRIHPSNPDIVWVAAFGKHSAPNPERGIFKSTDGGRTWRKVLYRDDKTGGIDLSLDPANPNVIYAALWEAFRKEYTMSSGGAGSGLFKSTDGGETWTEITRNRGLPAGVVGRIGVALSPANPQRVYALVENENGGLYRSDDAGATWTVVNQNRAIRQRAFYYTHVFADPKNADVVYMQNTALFRSADGGKTTTTLGGTHGDHHDLWIDPDDPTHIIDGNDGGGAVSFNTGQSWSAQDFPTAQWYHVITTKHVPYHVCGAQQDNSTLCVPSDFARATGAAATARLLTTGVATEPARGSMQVSYQAGGGEPGYIAPDPKDPDVFFSGTNNGGFMDRYDRRTGHRREVNPYPWHYSGEPAREIPERWQWTYPIIFSPVDPNVLYTSSQRLWRTTNGGQSWTPISGDLTRHDPSTLGHSGGPITGDMNGPEIYAVIFSIGPSKRDVNVIWTGSDDGLVHVTRDGGQTWTNVTPRDMPDFGRVSQIDASAFDVATAYISVRRPLLDDKAPYIFRTHDFGRTWTRIVNGIRADDWVHAVREDPTRRGLLYAATQHGVYISYNDGDSWESLSLNLPDVPVADLIVEANDLVIGTHGRGFYVLDDIAPLRQYTPEVANASDAWLFAPATALRSATPVALAYWLKRPAQRIDIDILDARGAVVRSFTSDTAQRTTTGPRPALNAGINRITWDLRHTGATTFPGMILWGATTAGPAAAPGTYAVRMRVDGREQVQPLTVQRNPRFTWISDEDLHEQLALGLQIRDKVSEANESVIQIREIKRDAADRLTKNNSARLRQLGNTLTTNLSDVEDDIYQVKNQSGQDPLNFPIKINNRLANLLRIINSGDGKPIANLPVLFQEYSRQLDVQTGRLQQVLTRDLAAFNAELRRLGLPVVEPKCQPRQTCNVVL